MNRFTIVERGLWRKIYIVRDRDGRAADIALRSWDQAVSATLAANARDRATASPAAHDAIWRGAC